MIKPDEKIYRALSNLHNDVNFAVIARWIEDSLIQQSVANNKTIGDITRINQGRNQELEYLLTCIRDADDNLRAIQHPIQSPIR